MNNDTIPSIGTTETSLTKIFGKDAHSERNLSMLDDSFTFSKEMSKNIQILSTDIFNLKESIDNNVKVVVINKLTSGYILKKSLSVMIKKDNDQYLAELLDLTYYGVGEDEVDAVNDLRKDIVLNFEDMKQNRKKLSNRMKQELLFLELVINDET